MALCIRPSLAGIELQVDVGRLGCQIQHRGGALSLELQRTELSRTAASLLPPERRGLLSQLSAKWTTGAAICFGGLSSGADECSDDWREIRAPHRNWGVLSAH